MVKKEMTDEYSILQKTRDTLRSKVGLTSVKKGEENKRNWETGLNELKSQSGCPTTILNPQRNETRKDG